ncbi:hypothetical protein NLI96_g10806 [Meripilus lineatus]|uniref:Amino acid permease/ SLC12A domain-containing protein n=1 Tax=Meripilus lineatus TaxID=2056292 RepID=A0AAD5Y8Z2_9APHY|nr:hypothetical protein NLI96_g10806 [Physisporinus lineatus]
MPYLAKVVVPMSSSLPTRSEEGVALRERIVPRRVHVAEPPKVSKPPRFNLDRQRRRVFKFQRRWKHIKEDLPPQISRRHIGMISIGGVIGTGLFLGSAVRSLQTKREHYANKQDLGRVQTSLQSGGPVGALLGYTIIGAVVYCLCVSVGEMIAFLPNVGGVVGLSDLYVDPALGFSLGWAAWYNWAVTLPAEITAAAVVVQFWDPKEEHITATKVAGIFLVLATAVNCFSSRVYGEAEFWFSTLKVGVMGFLIIVCIVLDVGAGKRKDWGQPILFHTWGRPFNPDYLGIGGHAGSFLGFLAVLMQASFSFFGSEVPGIAAGEVIDATRNVPRALKRVWIRILLFYLCGIFFIGLLVDKEDLNFTSEILPTANSSPFVMAFHALEVKALPHIVNAAILVSAWSAASSDIYVSSRCLFFLARRGHAPSFSGLLTKYPSDD